MTRHHLTDEQWAKVQPHLPPRAPGAGRPRKDDRLILDGLLWLTRTSSPWRDLPPDYGPWRTVYSRFYRWRQAGVWERLFAAVVDATQEADLSEVLFVDGSSVRAHQHAAGARGGSPSKP